MLRLTIPDRQYFDDDKQEFFTVKGQTISLEHSLLSISKWEAKWHKSFLNGTNKTSEEVRDYVRCMTLTKNVEPLLYYNLTPRNMEEITTYMTDSMSATKFLDKGSNGSREKVTSELIYYWMISYGIPFECQKWHLNRLMALIKVCHRKSQKPKKMGTKELMARNNELNAARRKQLGTRG